MLPELRPSQEILVRIRGEYLEMPGLSLTPAQAQRLWAIDRGLSEFLLSALLSDGFLARTHDGAFVRRGPDAIR